jgi:hypothetical protein
MSKVAEAVSGEQGAAHLEVIGGHDIPVEALLGDAVFWTIPTGEHNIEETESRFDAAGFDPKRYLPGLPSAKRQFTRAVDSCLSGKSRIKDEGGHYIVKQVRNIDDWWVYSIVQLQADSMREEASGKHVGRIAVKKDRESPEIRTEGHELASRIAERYSHLMTIYTDADLRGAVQKFLTDVQAFALRPTGGVYLVPQMHHDALDRFAGVFSECGATIYSAPILRDGASLKATSDAATNALWSRYRVFMAEVNGYTVEKVRDRTLEQKLAQFSELRELAGFYEGAFEARVDELREATGKLEERVRDLICAKTTPDTNETALAVAF